MLGVKKKINIYYVLLILILGLLGTTFSAWIWVSNESSDVAFVLSDPGLSCSADGGESINNADINIMPTNCNNANNALIREIKVNTSFDNTVLDSIYVGLWLNVNSLDKELSNTRNFRYTLTTSANSCSEGVITSGNFYGVTSGDKIKLLNNLKINNPLTNTYYLYIWLDSSETDPDTAGKGFDLSLSGECSNLENILPELNEGMIPVTISDGGTVTTVFENDGRWYDYDSKKWANAILVSEESRGRYIETTDVVVNKDDILAYYVWIPRYRYRIWTTELAAKGQERTIDIVFESAGSSISVGNGVSQYITHPAFFWDLDSDNEIDEGEMLSGFWVGKFETSGDPEKPTVLPDKTSLINQTVSNQFKTSLKFAGGTLNNGIVSFSGNDYYGLTSDSDSHMMKNTEWGAVSYLFHSKYGKNSEIYVNNSASLYTGRSAGSTGKSGVVSTTYGSYNWLGQSVNSDGAAGSFTTNKLVGTGASTTGNVTGVYDMVGGAYDRLMAVSEDTNGEPRSGGTKTANSGFNGMVSNGTKYTAGINFPESRYYDLYTAGDVLTACSDGVCFGHALSETNRWYNDYVSFLSTSSVWMTRGNESTSANNTNSGIFMYSRNNGAVGAKHTFRSVIISTGKYIISYDANGGSGGPSIQEKSHGATLILSDLTPTRSGYDFLGWSIDGNATNPTYLSGSEFDINSDVTLYAVWAPKTYTITYDANGGNNAPKAINKTSGIDLNLSTELPTRVGYNFLGWSINSSATVPEYQAGGVFSVDKDTTLYAIWSNATYIVSYDANGGTGGPGAQGANSAETIIISSVEPEFEGHVFLGWSLKQDAVGATYFADSSYVVNNDVTFYAVWKLESYTIKYDANESSVGGTVFSGVPEDQTISYGQTLRISDIKPSMAGYEFLGWATSSDATEAEYSPGGSFDFVEDTTLYAVWKILIRTLSFNANGGTGAPNSVTLDLEGVWEVLIPYDTPTKEGYAFSGWLDKTYGKIYFPGSYYNLASDITLYAVWEKTYTVRVRHLYYYESTTWKEMAVEELTIKSGDSYQPIYLSDGSIMVGYTTRGSNSNYYYYNLSDGTELGNAKMNKGNTITVNQDMRVHIHYYPESYTISYDANGGTGAPESQSKTFATDLTLSTDVPTRGNDLFLGWSTTADATAATYSPGDVYSVNPDEDGDVTLYAVWQKRYILRIRHQYYYQSKTWEIMEESDMLVNEGYIYTPEYLLSTEILDGYKTRGANSNYSYYNLFTGTQLGAANMDSGNTITVNQDMRVHIHYYPKTYTISYDVNGGEGALTAATKTHDVTLQLSGDIPTRSGYKFLGWSKSLSSTNVDYKPGDFFDENANTTLYAVWEATTVTINANRYVCEGTNRLAVYYVTTCEDDVCTYTSKNGLDSSNASWYDYDISGEPTWSINTLEDTIYSSALNNSSIVSGSYTCTKQTLYVSTSSGLNCRDGADTDGTSVVASLVYNTSVQVYRTTKKYGTTSDNWWYYPYLDSNGNETGCYLYGGYLSASSSGGSTGGGSTTTAEYFCLPESGNTLDCGVFNDVSWFSGDSGVPSNCSQEPIRESYTGEHYVYLFDCT